MNKIIFKYKGILFAVIYLNNEINYYKLENGNYTQLNDKEQAILNEHLYNRYSYIYNSEILKILVDMNNEIDNKDYLYNFLEWLEGFIPFESRHNFYRNIKTLSTDLNLDFTEGREVSSDNTTSGLYNVKYNILVMPKNSLGQMRNIANMTKNPNAYYWKEYSQTLLHELAHLASSNYDKNRDIALCGFDTYPAENAEDRNRGLTEGFTEIISMAGVPDTIEIASGYYIETLIVNQLIFIIGNEVFIKSYFSNLGIREIKNKLEELIPDSNKTFELFRNIELNYVIGLDGEEQNVLGNIQSTILDFLEVKFEKLLQLKDFEAINNTLKIYEDFLVTPEKLKIMKKNPDNYLGLAFSIQKFMALKDKYATLSKSNDELSI